MWTFPDLSLKNPERGIRDSFVFDLYIGMISAKKGAWDQMGPPGRPRCTCFGIRRSDDVEVFNVYADWIFRNTYLVYIWILTVERLLFIMGEREGDK